VIWWVFADIMVESAASIFRVSVHSSVSKVEEFSSTLKMIAEYS
jgi:hypothetical protein